MKRRGFLKLTGSAVATAMLPLGVLGLFSSTQRDYSLFSDYYNSLWADKTAAITDAHYMCYEYDKLTHSDETAEGDIRSHYTRCIELVMAAPGVTEQDIVDEFNSQKNNLDDKLITFAAEGNYSDISTFRAHYDVKTLTKMIKRFRQQGISKGGKWQLYNWSDFYGGGTRLYTTQRDGEYIIHKNYFSHNNKTHIKKEKLYSIEGFAHEMVETRRKHDSDEVQRRAEIEKNYHRQIAEIQQMIS